MWRQFLSLQPSPVIFHIQKQVFSINIWHYKTEVNSLRWDFIHESQHHFQHP